MRTIVRDRVHGASVAVLVWIGALACGTSFNGGGHSRSRRWLQRERLNVFQHGQLGVIRRKRVRAIVQRK